jgi:glycine/sarcosine N-methyltransferase
MTVLRNSSDLTDEVSFDNVVHRWCGTFEDPLASRWPAFVDCKRRIETEGPFLLHSLNHPSDCILDAAMGIGCESVFLAKRGLRVTGNEISPKFRALASAYARHEDVNLRMTSVDWRDLSTAFLGKAFDMVLLLGNSLCLLRESWSRLQTALNLRSVCRKGGVLIIDHRNFDYILSNEDQILSGDYRYSAQVIYCGKTIKGYPINITPDCVRFAYKDLRNSRTLGYLDMHPFREGEMVALFQKAGFECLGVYSDLTLGRRSDADFYTYVFR